MAQTLGNINDAAELLLSGTTLKVELEAAKQEYHTEMENALHRSRFTGAQPLGGRRHVPVVPSTAGQTHTWPPPQNDRSNALANDRTRGHTGGGAASTRRERRERRTPRALTSLSVAEVGRLLGALDLGQFAPVFMQKHIAGPDLQMIRDNDLKELGVDLAVHQRRLMASLNSMREEGVAPHLLRAALMAAPAVGHDGDEDDEWVYPSEWANEPAPEAASVSLNDCNLQCVICLDAKRDHVLLPCGHLCICGSCSPHLGLQCPVCRADVGSIHKVFDV